MSEDMKISMAAAASALLVPGGPGSGEKGDAGSMANPIATIGLSRKAGGGVNR